MATGAALKKMAAAICMVAVLFAGQLLMAAPKEAGPTGRPILQILSPGPIVFPCPPEPKCQACASDCDAKGCNSTSGITCGLAARACIFACAGREDVQLPCITGCKDDLLCILRCGEGQEDKSSPPSFIGPGMFCPSDPKCEACKSRCHPTWPFLNLGRAECKNECVRGVVPFQGCLHTKCETCASGCTPWTSVSGYKDCARRCGVQDVDRFPYCPTDAECEACVGACPACNTSPDCQNECKNKCVFG